MVNNNLKCITLTSGSPADTFGAWAEIVDSNAVTLSSKFAAEGGYLIELTTRDYSAADKIYIIELGIGGGTTVVGRVQVRSDWKHVLPLRSWKHVLPLRSVIIPAGSTVSYRMKCETAGATLVADFKYCYGKV